MTEKRPRSRPKPAETVEELLARDNRAIGDVARVISQLTEVMLRVERRQLLILSHLEQKDAQTPTVELTEDACTTVVTVAEEWDD